MTGRRLTIDPKGSNEDLKRSTKGEAEYPPLTQGKGENQDPMGSLPKDGKNKGTSPRDPRGLKSDDPNQSRPLELPKGRFATQILASLDQEEKGQETPSLYPNKEKGKNKRNLSGGSDYNDTPRKILHLQEDLELSDSQFSWRDLELSSVSSIDPEGEKLEIPKEGSSPKGGEGDFIEVTKKNRATHSILRQAAAFQDTITPPTPGPTSNTLAWHAEPLQYIYIMYTFVKGTLGEKKLQEFARGLAKHIGGFEAAYPPTSTHGPYFKVETGKANKASNYVHNGIEIKYTEIFMSKPECNGENR